MAWEEFGPNKVAMSEIAASLDNEDVFLKETAPAPENFTIVDDTTKPTEPTPNGQTAEPNSPKPDTTGNPEPAKSASEEWYKKSGMLRAIINTKVVLKFIGWLRGEPNYHEKAIAASDTNLLADAWTFFMISKKVKYSPMQYLVETNFVIFGIDFSNALLFWIGNQWKRKPIPAKPVAQSAAQPTATSLVTETKPEPPATEKEPIDGSVLTVAVPPAAKKCAWEGCVMEYRPGTGYPKNKNNPDYDKFCSRNHHISNNNRERNKKS